MRNIAIKIQQNKIIANLFVEPLTVIVVILMLIIAVEGLQLDVVQLLAFFFAYSLLMPRIKAINTEYLVITEKLPHFEKIHELISSHEKTYLPSGEKGVNTIETDITFIDVWFRYPQTEDFVLKEINFSINWLKTTALVGASGGGKTTIADLVLRLHDPSVGDITVNGMSLKELRMESWHKLVSVVDQDAYLFHDTVFNNIGYGCPSSAEADVYRAASLAHVDEFIERLPQGYETIVGNRGMVLSGGQKQRIALARALVRQPQILILDEATSSLDSESERFIKETIEDMKGKCTLLIIAHRISTIVNADRIVILQGGQIVEEGNHLELLARPGLYRRYYELQTET